MKRIARVVAISAENFFLVSHKGGSDFFEEGIKRIDFCGYADIIPGFLC